MPDVHWLRASSKDMRDLLMEVSSTSLPEKLLQLAQRAVRSYAVRVDAALRSASTRSHFIGHAAPHALTLTFIGQPTSRILFEGQRQAIAAERQLSANPSNGGLALRARRGQSNELDVRRAR